jgi:PAS domain S-box-containing protein
MKILYLAQDCTAAEVALRALARLAPNVRVTWAPSPEAAIGWLREHADAQAVITEAGREAPAFDDFLEQVRAAGVTVPVAAAAPEHLEALAAALEANLEALAAEERERVLQEQSERDTALARTARVCVGLQEQLFEAEALLQEARQREIAQTAATERLAVREAELSAAVAEETALRGALEERLAAAQIAREDASRTHASELASLTARLDEREAELASLTIRLHERQTEHDSSLSRLNRICTGLQHRLLELEGQNDVLNRQLGDTRLALEHGRQEWLCELTQATERYAALEVELEASRRETLRLRQDADGLQRQLDVMRTRADTLRRHAAQVPLLQVQLDRTLKENRRQFERAPYGLCEFTKDGGITRVNHSFVRLLGYRTAADLEDVDLADTIFESATDLRWLLDRALETGRVESLETTLTRRELGRLSVRLHAHSQDGSVTVAVEDLTALHEAEHRLREAQRLEAVGRVASEVATACDTLLHEVSQGGRQWLAALDNDAPLRQQGELLLGDVSRASGLLRQVAVYGHQQINTAGSVNVTRALRDMAPLLKRVLGDDILLLLPRLMGRLYVDVDAGRVERILVNVANYARERMPHGGRVKIRLGTVTLDRQFVASHPKVRPGAHVLITIEEIQGPVWPPLPVHLTIGRPAHHDAARVPAHRHGIDLGPLVALIGEVGGHLWMSAEPAGNMTLQLHLPKRTEENSQQPVAAAAGRARQLTRWFRH